MKILLTGLPGSGKSLLVAIIQEQGYDVVHLDDYPILCSMFHQEGERTGHFRAISPGDFDVLDHAVYDEALQALEHQARAYGERTVLIIEFARDDYAHALAQFSQDFLSDAICLYVDTDLETCLERVRIRAMLQMGHAVSLEVMQGYYGRQVLPTSLPVEVIDNNGTQEAFREQVRQFASTHLETVLAVR